MTLAGFVITENGAIDVRQLNELYFLIGWDNARRRTLEETAEMLAVSRYYVAAYVDGAKLVGFARVCGDPYVAQVLDVITHPGYRRRGVAGECMRRIVDHVTRSRYVSVTLTDSSGLDGFYDRFGFEPLNEVARRWNRRR